MPTPPTPEGLAVYKRLYELENLLRFMLEALEKIECHGYLVFGLKALKRRVEDLHEALDRLRVSLDSELPTPDEIREMGGSTILGGPGGGK